MQVRFFFPLASMVLLVACGGVTEATDKGTQEDAGPIIKDMEQPDRKVPPDLPRPDLKPDVAPDLKPDVAPDLKPDVAPDLKPDITPDTFKPDADPCGNGVINMGEKCDGKNLGGNGCADKGFSGGVLGCKPDCTDFDTSACYKCGDGKVDKDEDCDGTILPAKNCKGLSFDDGTLGCDKVSCKYDTSACYKCGDGTQNTGEVCDGNDLAGASCSTLSFTDGPLKCKADCSGYDTAGCYKCGDSKINPGEQCDGTNYNNKTCSSLLGTLYKGNLACDKTKCTFITTGCYSCGDGKVNPGEECDGIALAGYTCSTVSGGFAAGDLKCTKTCTFDKSGCTRCGNGKIDVGEVCDGNNLNSNTCQTENFDKGQLKCKTNCTLDKSGCENITCGNGKIEPGEDCEGTDLNQQNCGKQGFTAGNLACAKNCIFDKSGCYKCGDGSIDSGEECDGKNLGSATCKLNFDDGQIACKSNCTLDTSGCYKCGDGKVNTGEQCDGVAFNNKDCISEGFFAGALKCTSSCTLDTSGCTNCGNGKIDSGEDCDGLALGGKGCTTFKFHKGTLKCDSKCKFDTSDCKFNKCGDGTVDPGEECDGTNLNKTRCIDKKFVGGELACLANCKFDYNKCYRCGDGIINGGETCDGKALNNKGCTTISGSYTYHSGTLACSSDCNSYDTSGCNRCGDGALNGSEKCDGTKFATGTSCTDLGYDGGQIKCKSDCSLDPSPCYKCGDGTVGGSEKCDGTALNGNTCQKAGYHAGNIKCSTTCTLDLSDCHDCGDGKIDSGEQCDGTALNGKTCVLLGEGYYSGQLACNTNCKFDRSGCTKVGCGNGTLDSGEECDKTALGGKTCVNINKGYNGGSLACTAACKLDTDSCTYCGDGKIDSGEECDGAALGGKSCADSFHHGGTLACDASCKLDKTRCIDHKWITVKAGTFSMGATTTSPCYSVTEQQHSVTLTSDFEISNTEVTQGQYKTLMSASPAYFSSCGSSCPVEQVSWHQAAAYCNALSSGKGLGPCYSCSGSGASTSCTVNASYAGKSIYECPGYRLPTEAEWEYAYRAGSTTDLHNANISSANCQGTDANAGLIAWYNKNSSSKTHAVGSKVPNLWGLYDMAGNVWEWCHDWYATYLGTSAVTDPFGATSATERVKRSGAYDGKVEALRAAQRYKSSPATANGQLGFRCARTLNPSLVAHWKLDDGSGTKATDSSGNGYHSTTFSGPGWGTGWVGKALVFGGAGDHLEFPEPYAVDQQAITITAWIKTSTADTFRQILGNGQGASTPHFEFGVTQGGYLHLSKEISGGVVLKSKTRVNTNSWTHVAWTRDASGNDKLYINGVLDASQTVVGDISNKLKWRMGCLYGYLQNCFKGSLDDVRVYRKALPAADILAQYKAADPKFRYFTAGSTVTGATDYLYFHDLHVTPGGTLLLAFRDRKQLRRSTDKGQSWTTVTVGSNDLNGPRLFDIDSSTVGLSTILGGGQSALRHSTNDGQSFPGSWINFSNLSSGTQYHGVVFRSPKSSTTYLGAWNSGSLYHRESTSLTSWSTTTPPKPLSSTGVTWPVFYSVGTKLYLLVHSDAGVEFYESSNYGVSHTLVGKPATHKIGAGWRARHIWRDASSGYWYVCGATAPGTSVGVYYTYSRDGGKTWDGARIYLEGFSAGGENVSCRVGASGVTVGYVTGNKTKVVLPGAL